MSEQPAGKVTPEPLTQEEQDVLDDAAIGDTPNQFAGEGGVVGEPDTDAR